MTPTWLRDLRAAVQTFTIFPWPGQASAPGGRILAWSPLVGLFLGAAASLPACWALELGGAMREGHWGGAALGGLFYVGGLVLGTRGFHLDGLADTCDGWGGGWTRERTLEIMRDSHLGTFGALALGLALLAKWLGATLILGLGGWPLLLLIPLWSRVIMVGQAAGNAYARPEEAQRLAGLIVSATGWNHLLAALGLALSLVGLGWLAGGERLGPLWWSSNWRFLGWGGIAALLIALGARRRLGGVTGDILGATLEVAEAVGLVGGALYLLSLGGAPGALLG